MMSELKETLELMEDYFKETEYWFIHYVETENWVKAKFYYAKMEAVQHCLRCHERGKEMLNKVHEALYQYSVLPHLD